MLSSFAALLQRFSLSKDVLNALCIHHCMFEIGNTHNTLVYNMLLDVYGKCGLFRDAYTTFSFIYRPDATSYSFIINAYGRNKKKETCEAFSLFGRLLIEGIIPNKFVFVALLSLCARPERILRGKHIHVYVISSGIHSDVVVRTALVHMYNKCMNLDMVKVVFETMPDRRDAILWNATILAYAHHGDVVDALYLFGEMQREEDGIVANRATFLTMLNLCRTNGLLDEGKWIHYYIMCGGLDDDSVIGTSLISMYGKLFSLNDARNVFEQLPQYDVAIWNSIISVYAQNEMGKDALSLFDRMHGKGVLPDMITFVSILSSCANLEALHQGLQIHVLATNDDIDGNIILRNSLLNFYCKCGICKDMERIFSDMHTRDVFSWNAMLSGCIKCEKTHFVLRMYYQMMEEGAIPDAITFIALLSCYLSLVVVKRVHICIRSNKHESDVIVGTALVNMYGKCASPDDAEMGFNDIIYPNVFSWNAMIAVFSQQGSYNKAFNVFNKMTWEGVIVDKVTFHSILSLCTKPEYLVSGKWLHTLLITRGIDSDVLLGNALINMYGKSGEMSSASVAFDRMSEHDHFSWNALIMAYVQGGNDENALKIFHEMVWEGFLPDKVTFSSILSVCSSPESIGKCRELHVHIRASCIDVDQVVGNALVTMYGKCDSIDDSLKSFYHMQEQNDVSFIAILSICANQVALEEGMKLHAIMVESDLEPINITMNALLNMYGKCGSMDDTEIMFNKMQNHDLVSWNIMISAYSQNGDVQNVFFMLKKMQVIQLVPDKATFVSILSACSHGGYIEEGWFFLLYMQYRYDLTPSSDHYNCMIDLLGRVGLKDEAEALIYKMPVDPTVVSWMTLLGACRNQDDIEGGERATERILRLDVERTAPYVVLSNMYANSLKLDSIQLVNLV